MVFLPKDAVEEQVVDRLAPSRSKSTRRWTQFRRWRWLSQSPFRIPILILREARLPIVAIFLIRIVVTSEVLIRPSTDKVILTLAWVALTVSAYVFNGISDLAGDRLNGSTRPLACGSLSVRTAASWSFVLAALGLAGCWMVGPAPGALGSVSLALGWAYSAGPALKQSATVCALTVWAATALTYLAGAWVAGDAAGLCISLALWASWLGVASPIKDFSDLIGDRYSGRRTLPVVFGPVRAARALAVGVLTWSALVTVGMFALAPRIMAVGCVTVAGSLAIAAALLRVRSGQSRGVLRRPYRVLMVTQFLVNLVIFVCSL